MHFLTLLISLVPVIASLEERTSCPTASPAALQNVKKAFTSAGLVPAYISSFNPTLLANITYPQATGGSAMVALGNIFNTTQTLIQPTVLLTAEKDQPSNTTYSLFFINFDNPVPSAPPSAHLPFLHWQESGLTPCNGAAGNQVQAFIPSVPQSVDQNRYTYLLFREPAGYVANPITTADRIILNVVATAAAQGLKLVGGNYFLEGEIDNVP